MADIEVEQLDAVRRITLNRTEVLNSISWIRRVCDAG